MQATIILSNDAEKFPVGKRMSLDAMTPQSIALNLYKVIFDGEEYLFQCRTSKFPSLHEAVVEGFLEDGAKFVNLGLSITAV